MDRGAKDVFAEVTVEPTRDLKRNHAVPEESKLPFPPRECNHVFRRARLEDSTSHADVPSVTGRTYKRAATSFTNLCDLHQFTGRVGVWI